MKRFGSLFGSIGDHQKAVETGDESLEKESIRQLSNNKIKVKKGKKDGNNNK